MSEKSFYTSLITDENYENTSCSHSYDAYNSIENEARSCDLYEFYYDDDEFDNDDNVNDVQDDSWYTSIHDVKTYDDVTGIFVGMLVGSWSVVSCQNILFYFSTIFVIPGITVTIFFRLWESRRRRF